VGIRDLGLASEVDGCGIHERPELEAFYRRRMGLTLRSWKPADEPFLWDMLYEAIHVADVDHRPPRSILSEPSISHYLSSFGAQEGDDAVIACDGGSRVGAAFCRLFTEDDPAYGFVSPHVPEVGMAVLRSHRGKGVGRAMLEHLLNSHPTMSLSVDAGNRVARKLYESLGFVDLRSEGDSVTMIRRP
jgi:ribosomal protein S18 acetylase RimI-like enzyme